MLLEKEEARCPLSIGEHLRKHFFKEIELSAARNREEQILSIVFAATRCI